jgi:small conductance mechanosensitive channel
MGCWGREVFPFSAFAPLRLCVESPVPRRPDSFFRAGPDSRIVNSSRRSPDGATMATCMTNIWTRFKHAEFADPGTLLGAVAYAIGFWFLAWLLSRMVRSAVERALARDRHSHLDRTTLGFLAQLARICIYVFAFISYAHLVPSLSSLGTAWLASVSVISVVVGLAAQNTLGNLVAGVALVLYRPFKVGDRVQVAAPAGPEIGVVESVNLGYTALKTDDNRRVILPNSIVASQTMINFTISDARLVCSVPFTISLDSDLDKARAILLELARANPKAQKVADCPVTQLDAFGVTLTLMAWCADSVAAGDFKNGLLEQAKRRFDAEGIRFPAIERAVVAKR